MKTKTNFFIQWLTRRDMPEVLAIENQSFEFPWSEEDFLRYLRQRNCIGMIAEHGEQIVGFMIYAIHKDKLHLLNFAVRKDFRRRGVGGQMLRKLVGKLSSHRRTRLVVRIRETNLPAQLFFKKQEFKAVRITPGYYKDSGEDAFLFRYSLGDKKNAKLGNQ